MTDIPANTWEPVDPCTTTGGSMTTMTNTWEPVDPCATSSDVISIDISDGVHTVTNATSLEVVGEGGLTAVVSGTTPDAVLTLDIPPPGITIGDGTHTVVGAKTVTFSGGTVSGSSPNGVVTLDSASTIVSGSNVNVVVFDTLAHATAATIDPTITSIQCLAYVTPGDLRGDVMIMKRVGLMPSFPGYVQSADGAYWQLSQNEVNVFMFGAFGIGDSGHDDWPAIRDAILYCNGIAVPHPDNYNTTPTLIFPPAAGYYCSQTIAITLPMRIIGYDLGEGHTTIPIQFPVGVTGMTVAAIVAPFTYLKGLCLVGVTDKPLAHPIAHGFSFTAPVVCERCSAFNFSGCGFINNGNSGGPSGGIPYGFTDMSIFRCCMAFNNGRHGFWTIGGDANLCIFEQCNATSNAGWGFKDAGKYTNKYDTCHSRANGWPVSATAYSDSLSANCSYGGVVYTAAATDALTGAPPTASTTPPGPGNTAWIATTLAPGGYYQPWVSGGYYREGGDFFNAGFNSIYLNCYSEGGAGISQLYPPSLVIGGQWNYNLPPGWLYMGLYNQQSMVLSSPVATARNVSPNDASVSEDIACYWGPGFGQPNSIRTIQASASGGFFEYLFNKDLLFDVSLSAGGSCYVITGQGTTNPMGAAVFKPYKFALYSTDGDITISANHTTTGPAGGGVGSFQFNTQFTLGGPFGWMLGSNGATYGWIPIAGVTPPCTIAALPPAQLGARGMVTNSSQIASGNFGALLSGTTGANIVPVYGDGSSWRIG